MIGMGKATIASRRPPGRTARRKMFLKLPSKDEGIVGFGMCEGWWWVLLISVLICRTVQLLRGE